MTKQSMMHQTFDTMNICTQHIAIGVRLSTMLIDVHIRKYALATNVSKFANITLLVWNYCNSQNNINSCGAQQLDLNMKSECWSRE